MVKSQITTIILFLFLIFYIEKFILFRKNIWKNLVYIITFVLQFFCVAGYLKRSSENTNTHLVVLQALCFDTKYLVID